ncbi:helicase IV [Bifidobacterium sp. DSM 109958]|uniref:DNA 3'-5' helicase n=1 Tax=Bifidobacterium moraviense TaxID=2675323 RepID=A0A7Y0F2N7_9BIFI|nr:UvrD-helicase domain-containing protein [Bifidobacterium sp. DSM 109958]NMN00931.1 helicase IV [Bifidobacterium sp. DSM 109958]
MLWPEPEGRTATSGSATTSNVAAASNTAAASNVSARPRLKAHPPLSEARLAKARAVLGPVEGHELSDEQLSAIAGAGHNTLVLAGAGTGKTTVINGYVAWLLATGRARPEQILVLSFTKASADEMAARIRMQTGQRVRACTFHSLGLEICRAATGARLTVMGPDRLDRVVSDAFRARLAADEDYRRLVLAMLPPAVRGGWRALLGQNVRGDSSAVSGGDSVGDATSVSSTPGVARGAASAAASDTAAARACRQYADRLLADARTIIQHMRANGLDVAALRRLNADGAHSGAHSAARSAVRSNAGPAPRAIGRNADLLAVIEPLYAAYVHALAAEHGVDFAGMIADAVHQVRVGRYVHGFTHVLVDEYQDLSRPRCELIRALREQRDFDLFAVGDDWQSIYRFAGSDIRLILDFPDVWRDWGPSRMFRLSVTRRFRTSLIEASGRFVMADGHLYAKRLTCENQKQDHSVKALGGMTAAERFDVVTAQLAKLPRRASVLMLGRYASDVGLILDNDREGLFELRDAGTDGGAGRRLVFRDRPDLDIRFMTVHASKGLQCDFTFLLSCSGGVRGFPSAVPDEPLLGLILPETESFPDAEERRLCYVAMTRCRRKLFLVVDRARPSRFMYELRDICPGAFRGVTLPPRCPDCGEALTLRHAASRGGDGAFYGCTAWPACAFTRPCR